MKIYADDMILYQKDPEKSTKKLQSTINSFSKVTGYKIILQKSVAFPYIKMNRLNTGKLFHLQ
jgi:hypothetical protein